MCTYLGASVLLEPKDIDLSLVREAKILYLEGYLWDNPAAKNAFIKAAEIAKNAGRKVALSLSDSFCVSRHRESFIKLVDDHIDILFANEDEITNLYETYSLSKALEKLKKKCDLAAITIGEKGSILISNGKEIKIDPFILGKAVDTTGAGDAFVGAFSYGIASGYTTEDAIKIGVEKASDSVTRPGTQSSYSI